jgi:hypothetical protein
MASDDQLWLERVERVLAELKRPPRLLERDGAYGIRPDDSGLPTTGEPQKIELRSA